MEQLPANHLMDVIQFLQRNSIVAMVAAFLAIAVWAYWPSNRSEIEKDAQIPFRDEP
jgi:cbb3-type cytochrome oxidase subunit 3